MDHIGVDVHKQEGELRILGAWASRSSGASARRPSLSPTSRAPAHAPRALLEDSTASEWVARCLKALSHQVIVANPNFAPMYATRTRKIKTDRRDARAGRGLSAGGVPLGPSPLGRDPTSCILRLTTLRR